MFVLSQQDNALFRVIATLVSIALVLWGLGTHVKSAQAANVTDVFVLLSSSATSTASNHTIEFVTPTGMAAGGTATITFPVGFNLTTITEDDVDLAVNGADEDTAAAAAGADWGITVSGQDLVIESGTDTIGAGATVTVEVGDNADFAGTGSNQVVNPGTQGSYEFDFDINGFDAGHTRVAIVDSVYVTASVDTVFDFTVTGFTVAGTSANGTSTTGTTTATALPFGTLGAGGVETLAQRLQVQTNAINGFVVTVETDHQLLSSTGADIDGFRNGTFDDTPVAWEDPSNSISDENTWGHWGLTSEDSDLNGDEFGSNLWVSASTTPRQVFSHTGPADNTTVDIGSTTVAYQVEITALQEAADDYEAILTYIATPTF